MNCELCNEVATWVCLVFEEYLKLCNRCHDKIYPFLGGEVECYDIDDFFLVG